MAVTVFVIIELDIVDRRLAEQLVSLVHLNAERAQNRLCLGSFLDNGIGHFILFARCIRQYRQIMVQQARISRKLHHLRVYEDELELGRVLGIQEGGNQHIESN